jgi:transcriptional regulator with XRE-family HTH domain
VSFQPNRPGSAEQERLRSGMGVILRAARSANGWTFAELGRRSGVKPGTISAYERGASRPSLTTLGRLATAFSPFDPDTARTLLRRIAEAAGASLNTPSMPAGVARESVTAVLVRALELLGLDPDDDRVRGAVRRAIAELDDNQQVPAGGVRDRGHPMVRSPAAEIEAPLVVDMEVRGDE